MGPNIEIVGYFVKRSFFNDLFGKYFENLKLNLKQVTVLRKFQGYVWLDRLVFQNFL